VKWLSKRVGQDLTVPALGQQGFELVAGAAARGKGPVAQFMYQNSKGQRLTLYVSRRMRNARYRVSLQPGRQDRGVLLIDGKLGYAAAAEMDRAQLLGVATVVYRQLTRSAGNQSAASSAGRQVRRAAVQPLLQALEIKVDTA